MKKSWWTLVQWLCLALIFFLFFRIAFFGEFIDEHENLVAGWLIFKGLVPYRDFFFHHAPLPFFVASVFFPWAQTAWWVFRAAILGYGALVGGAIWQLAEKRFRPALLLTGLLLAIAAPKLNLEMYLADSVFAISFLAAVVLTMSWKQTGQPTFARLFKWLLFLTFLSSWSTITAIFPFGCLLIAVMGIQLRHSSSVKKLWAQTKKPLGWFFFSTAVFPFYFLVNHALADFWWSVVTYNQQYYFPLRLADTAAELRWGILYTAFTRLGALFLSGGQTIWQILVAFVLTAKGLLFALGTISSGEILSLIKVWLWTPVAALTADANTVLTLGLWSLLLVFVARKQWKNIFGLTLISGLLYLRNNELFHFGVLFTVIFWLISWLFVQGIRQRRAGQALAMGFFLFIATLHFLPSYGEQLSNHFPIVSQAHQAVAKQISVDTQQNDTVQVIGGTTIYYLLANRLPASKYLYYFPWFMPVEKIRGTLLNTIRQKSAQTVVVEETFDPELVELVQNHYSKLSEELYR